MNDADSNRLARRTALKWIGVTLATFPMLDWDISTASAGPMAARTLSDPDMLHPTVMWSRSMTKEELRAVTALCDVIIPADEKSPSASKVGVPDFIDEWVSAPYPTQQDDKKMIQEGLAWLNTESKKRFQKDFADLSDDEKTKICDDICFAPKAKAEFTKAAEFFARVRDLTCTGFYTTNEGMKDLQYIGNIPLLGFKGPPKEVLEKLQLT